VAQTIEAVPRIVQLIRSKNYELATVPELIREMRLPSPAASAAAERPPAAPSQEPVQAKEEVR